MKNMSALKRKRKYSEAQNKSEKGSEFKNIGEKEPKKNVTCWKISNWISPLNVDQGRMKYNAQRSKKDVIEITVSAEWKSEELNKMGQIRKGHM